MHHHLIRGGSPPPRPPALFWRASAPNQGIWEGRDPQKRATIRERGSLPGIRHGCKILGPVGVLEIILFFRPTTRYTQKRSRIVVFEWDTVDPDAPCTLPIPFPVVAPREAPEAQLGVEHCRAYVFLHFLGPTQHDSARLVSGAAWRGVCLQGDKINSWAHAQLGSL